MVKFCLTKEKTEEFKKLIKNGTLDPFKLNAMTSAQRRAAFAKYFGDFNAKHINALFESKLLLKHQKKGMINWVKQVGGISEPAKRDFLSRIQRIESILIPEAEAQFLEDFAAHRFGGAITQAEAKKVFEMAELTRVKKAAIPKDSPDGSPEKIEYGTAYVLFKDYVGELKLEKPTLKELLRDPKKLAIELAGSIKGMVATLDNSFFGRQGIKIFYNEPQMWANGLIRSFSDIGKELRGIDAKTPIEADVYSRTRALDGTYNRMGLDVGLDFEEAFPSALPELIPAFGRLFKASETAFSGGAMRLRADYGDKMINLAEEQGVNILDKLEAESIGNLANVMTGRGSIGKLGAIGKELNVILFSVRFLASNFSTLFKGIWGAGKVVVGKVNPRVDPKFAEKQAAKALLKMVAGMTAILVAYEQITGREIEKDPRATNFARIPFGNRYFDISGGVTSVISLAVRLMPTLHNGEWGWWYKSPNGDFKNLFKPGFGQRSVLDVFEDYWEGKLSPVAGALRDIWSGQHFDGSRPSPKSIAKRLITPISVQELTDMLKDPNSEYILISMLLEGLGFSMSTPFSTNWANSDSKEFKAFREQVGLEKFTEANIEYNMIVSDKTNAVTNTQAYKDKSDENKRKAINTIRKDTKKFIFDKFNFTP